MRARAQVVVEGRISDAEALWYDTARWPSFVDGFHNVASADAGWPVEGTLVWDSTPGGRGRVLETVERYEPRVGQISRVEDPTTVATQTIAFAADGDDRVRVTLDLRWALKDRRFGPVGALVDLVFIRPRQREALARTLLRFARELASDRSVNQ
jgi:Polyketide cyclase / dehydrase and lipid transport